MTTRSVALITTSIFFASVLGAAATPRSAPLLEFTAAVHQYAALHRRLEAQLPVPRVTDSVEEMRGASHALAAAIQAARLQAREGDIFKPAIAAYLRVLIADSLSANGFLAEELLASNLEEADTKAPSPVVNGRFPWGRGALTWPCLLDVLPTLPQELQYRFVGRDLVLLDVDADLVVDILRDAIRP